MWVSRGSSMLWMLLRVAMLCGKGPNRGAVQRSHGVVTHAHRRRHYSVAVDTATTAAAADDDSARQACSSTISMTAPSSLPLPSECGCQRFTSPPALPPVIALSPVKMRCCTALPGERRRRPPRGEGRPACQHHATSAAHWTRASDAAPCLSCNHLCPAFPYINLVVGSGMWMSVMACSY